MLTDVSYYLHSKKYSFGMLSSGSHFPGDFHPETLQNRIFRPHVW